MPTHATSARSVRESCRLGEVRGPTSELAPGYVQANLIAVPKAFASDFLGFAERNPKPCPIIEVVEGGVEATHSAPGSDIRTDIPGYRLFRNGEHVDSATDATEWWREDLVSFLLGCSFSFEAAMLRNGLPVRHHEVGTNVPMFITDRQCEPSGPFSGPLVVSYRPMPLALVDQAVAVTAEYGHAHGGPVHVGSPSVLGISSLSKPDFGDPVPINDGEVPMFWACGVTPQLALLAAAPDIAISHEPGQMFVTDLSDTEESGSREE